MKEIPFTDHHKVYVAGSSTVNHVSISKAKPNIKPGRGPSLSEPPHKGEGLDSPNHCTIHHPRRVERLGPPDSYKVTSAGKTTILHPTFVHLPFKSPAHHHLGKESIAESATTLGGRTRLPNKYHAT